MRLYKGKKNIITVLAAAFMLVLIPLQSSAQEYDQNGGGVNSGIVGLILQGGYGVGATTFGNVQNSSSNSTLGAGPGKGYELSALLNISILALKVNYTNSTFSDMKWTQNNQEFETIGDGYFSTLDALFGLKVFTESGDMGYTHLYGGYRYWKAVRNVDYTKRNGVQESQILFPATKYDITGSGWIAGFQDLSTLPLGLFSLAFQTGLWVDSAPMSKLKINGAELNNTVDQGFGFGLNFGLGVAFEDMGLLVLAGYKMDITATKFTVGTSDWINGAGYGLFYLSVAKEF